MHPRVKAICVNAAIPAVLFFLVGTILLIVGSSGSLLYTKVVTPINIAVVQLSKLGVNLVRFATKLLIK